MMTKLAQQVAEAKAEAESKIFEVIQDLHENTGLCADRVVVHWIGTPTISCSQNNILCEVEVQLRG